MNKFYHNQTDFNNMEHNSNNFYIPISTMKTSFLTDVRLDATEIGIMMLLFKHCNDKNWIVNITNVQKESKIGRIKFSKAEKHLKELGYLQKETFFGCYKWTINEMSENNQ